MTAFIALLRKEPGFDYGMATEALAFHLDGMLSDGEAVPQPSSLEATMSDLHNHDAVGLIVDVPTRTVLRPATDPAFWPRLC